MPKTATVETLRPASVDPDEVEKFAKIAAQWWDPAGKFKPLHKFNPVRLGFIRDEICARFGRDADARRPFDGLKLLDVGCGGGLVSEPMARLGATVTGIDATEANVKTASVHAEQSGLKIDYRHGAPELLAEAGEGSYDVVLNLEVVEHVADVEGFLKTCASLVAPGGVMVLATINRTAKAFVTAIVGAEYVLGWLPRGTHQFDKLVRPDEIRSALSPEGLTLEGPIGVSYNPLTDAWRLSGDASVNYMMVAIKPG
ncbi:MAG: bifunctional 2-polyprenyl-6-hydroxyphenol methylase/3-demethylubiquinol 3-O-methyltransferase UbiG [Maricaulaceae bacterium]